MKEPTSVCYTTCSPTRVRVPRIAGSITSAHAHAHASICILRAPGIDATRVATSIDTLLRNVGIGTLELEVAHLLAVLALDTRHYH